MYSSLLNQLLHFSVFAFVFLFIFLLWPKNLFTKISEKFLENLFSNFVKMTFLLITIGYLLVVLKLFELLTIMFALLAFSTYRYFKQTPNITWEVIFDQIQVKLYDIADGVIHPILNIKKRVFNIRIRLNIVNVTRTVATERIFVIVTMLVTFGYSFYVRIYDSFKHAAPALSDAYITLDWMKHICNNILFYSPGGGIYPRGFHTCLAILQKFSALDPLYIHRYAGPIFSVYIILSLYFFVSRLSNNSTSGIISALLYGVLGGYLMGGDWERQAATNSQEFAFIFIFPTIYFFLKYIEVDSLKDLKIGALGITVMGLVHTLAYGFAAMGVGMIAVFSLISNYKKNWRSFLFIAIAGITSGIISLIPFGLGIMTGAEIHGSSADFLAAPIEGAISSPVLKTVDYLALISILILFAYCLVLKIKRKNAFIQCFLSLFGLTVFVIYYLGGVVTKSQMIVTRSDELWVLTIPVITGMAWTTFAAIIPFSTGKRIFQALTCIGILTIIFVIKPMPIQPYKMERDSCVEQYLNISKSFRPTTWTVFYEKEGYALIFGKGHHQYISTLLKYNPQEKGRSELEEDNGPDIFIYYQKSVYMVDKSNSIYAHEEEVYKKREEEKAQIEDWVQRYAAVHDNISVFYEDESLRVYHIHFEPTKEEEFETIWGT